MKQRILLFGWITLLLFPLPAFLFRTFSEGLSFLEFIPNRLKLKGWRLEKEWKDKSLGSVRRSRRLALLRVPSILFTTEQLLLVFGHLILVGVFSHFVLLLLNDLLERSYVWRPIQSSFPRSFICHNVRLSSTDSHFFCQQWSFSLIC